MSRPPVPTKSFLPQVLQRGDLLIPSKPTDDDPGREMRIGAIIAAVFFVGFLGWAAFARLDAAAYAQGQVSVAGHRQSVQHKEGGIVSALRVREGQMVTAGDVLIELAGGEAAAQAQSLSSQVSGLKAQRARLQAEQVGASTITWPAEFATLTGPERADAERAMGVQQAQFSTRLAALSAQKGVLRQKTAELAQQAEGYRRQITAADAQQKLLGDELAGTKSLAEKGYAPLTRVRALERAQAELGGQRGQYAAAVAQSAEEAGEARLQILQVDRQHAEDVAGQLRDIDFQLNTLAPKLEAARDELARTQVRSPATGTVVGLSVFTVGGVIAPGQKLMDVVPLKAPLVVEAQVSPNDADDLHLGQKVEVRFTAIRERGLPILMGSLTKLSADSFVEEKSGARYFAAEVTVPLRELDKLQEVKGPNFSLRPGLPVQVLVPLRRRTALQYLFEPLVDSFWRSFREH
ncbi:MAG TPA: HlyD family type I secretion periplasmic adaptor subunit [Caulobacteraceae bacterium]|nr:HlyD family type I secretion periplasmic adaptor subunit [Caulobacteraceae bacterium]